MNEAHVGALDSSPNADLVEVSQGVVRDHPRRIFGSQASYQITTSWAKRVVDIVGALCLLTLSVPLMIWIGLVVGADGGQVLYRDKRFGRNGIVFECLKIRTMHPDSEQILAEHLAQAEPAFHEWNVDFKLRDDPRVTKIGRVLRKSGLDELPQLWNVLIGDMSLVGPRPIPVSHGEEQLYGRYIQHYRSMRPGLTGLWQVSGRNDVPYRRRIAMVVYYVRHWSLTMDLLILLRTVGAVISARGGY